MTYGLASSLAGALFAPPMVVGGYRYRRARDRCPRCSHLVPESATICAGCGATIAGRLERASDLLARQLEYDEPGAEDESAERRLP